VHRQVLCQVHCQALCQVRRQVLCQVHCQVLCQVCRQVLCQERRPWLEVLPLSELHTCVLQACRCLRIPHIHILLTLHILQQRRGHLTDLLQLIRLP